MKSLRITVKVGLTSNVTPLNCHTSKEAIKGFPLTVATVRAIALTDMSMLLMLLINTIRWLFCHGVVETNTLYTGAIGDLFFVHALSSIFNIFCMGCCCQHG